MSTQQGWISLHRQITETAIYQDSQAVHLWVHILLKANHKPKSFIFHGDPITVERGQFITGRKTLSIETGIHESKIERLLKMFVKCGMIEQQTNSKNRLISITNYSTYQQSEQQSDSERTTTEQQLNTNNNDNNVNNETNGIGKAKPNPVPFKAIVDLYHEILPELPQVMKLTDKRKGQIRQRWNDGDLPDLDTWRRYFLFIRKSGFLMGKAEPIQGRKHFMADLEWLTNQTNYAKIYEGKYHDGI